jgi:hypothetical protein
MIIIGIIAHGNKYILLCLKVVYIDTIVLGNNIFTFRRYGKISNNNV